MFISSWSCSKIQRRMAPHVGKQCYRWIRNKREVSTGTVARYSVQVFLKSIDISFVSMSSFILYRKYSDISLLWYFLKMYRYYIFMLQYFYKLHQWCFQWTVPLIFRNFFYTFHKLYRWGFNTLALLVYSLRHYVYMYIYKTLGCFVYIHIYIQSWSELLAPPCFVR